MKTFLEDVLQTHLEDVLKDQNLLRGRLLQDIFKTSWKTKNRYAEDAFKTSSRRFGKQEMFAGILAEFSDRVKLFA